MTGLPVSPELRQGGDLRALPFGAAVVDLSTCVNRLGPPPAVTAALARFDPAELCAHPFQAERSFQERYAHYLGTSPDLLVIGRGISEFIRLLADLLPQDKVVVVTPDYTDSIRSFTNHLPPRGLPDTVADRVDRINDGLGHYRYVLLSNPNNPLGLHIPPARLAELCDLYPASTLIVDEAYIDFTAAGRSVSMVGADLDNLVVLVAPNKPFGIAGSRTGALWTKDAGIRREIAARRPNWPISTLDALVANAAVGATAWLAETRAHLLANATRMETALRAVTEQVVAGTPVHYRFVYTDDALALHSELAHAGFVVRAFTGRQPGRAGGLRLSAPLPGEITGFTEAISTLDWVGSRP